MAESTTVSSKADFLDDDLSILIGDYSIPHFSEISPDSALTQSQYAKVIFHDIADTYPTDSDICCRYTLTDGVTPEHGDRVALYRVGWTLVQDFIQFEWAVVPQENERPEMQVLFRAVNLPKDVIEFYQLCYLKSDNSVCGASIPFQFRRPHENELCEVEDSEDGIMVVRTRTAVAEERLRKMVQENEAMQKEKDVNEGKLLEMQATHDKVLEDLESVKQKVKQLEEEKTVLEQNLQSATHVQRHVSRLQSDIQAIDAEKNNTSDKLRQVQRHLEVLSATVDTLTTEKKHMTKLLREETQRNTELQSELQQLTVQTDSLNHMLEAMAESKEMVANEMRLQQETNTEAKEYMLRLLHEEKQRNAELRAQLWQTTTQLDNLSHMLDVLRQSKELVTNELRTHQDSNSELSSALVKLKLELDCGWEREEELRQQATALECRTQEQEQWIVNLEKEKQELQEQLKALQNDKDEQGKKLDISEQASRSLEMRVTELKLRLELAANEYKKLYSEKYRIERKLSKLKREKKKQQDGSSSLADKPISALAAETPTRPRSKPFIPVPDDSDSDAPEHREGVAMLRMIPEKTSQGKSAAKANTPTTPVQAEAKTEVPPLDSLTLQDLYSVLNPELSEHYPNAQEWIDHATKAKDGNKGGPNFCFICPFCSVTFPPGAYDLFSHHFDNHLS